MKRVASAADVARMLTVPEVGRRLAGRLGSPVHVTRIGKFAYQVTGACDDLVLRFAQDEASLSALVVEAHLASALLGRTALQMPDTEIIDGVEDWPAFAVHRMIPGEPLTSECYNSLSPLARERLVRDLASFFHDMHRIPLQDACVWLGIPWEGKQTVVRLAEMRGKPTWFSPAAVTEMRPGVAARLETAETAAFEDTIGRFRALTVDPGNMVVGHGDMHGYNMGIGADSLGARLVGVFDLGCAGILDIHEDFFRLSLISEDLLERVMDTYREISGRTRPLDRDRIAIYYRAFLFYLMEGSSGSDLSDLKALLKGHVATYGWRRLGG
jgi:aminoglycoside phosphotransferase